MKKALLVGVGLILVLLLVFVAFGLPVGEAFGRVIQGAVGSEAGLSRTLVRMTPLLLISLGIVIAWRAGLFNIGGEGQYIVGGLFGASIALFQPNTVLILVATALGGALYALVAAWLQIARQVQVVISTILLNFVAVQLLNFAVRGPLQEEAGRTPQSERLPDAAMLARFNPQTDLHVGVWVAVALAILVSAWMFLTPSGFRVRLVGAGPGAARANRIPVSRVQYLAMGLSGALCGLAGGIELTGIAGRLDAGFPQNYGFLAIPVALLGGLHPLGAAASSFVFGGLLAGSTSLARVTAGGDRLIYVIQGLMVLGYLAFQAYESRPLKEAA